MTYSDFQDTITRYLPYMHVSFMSLASFDSGKALEKRKLVENYDKRIKDEVHYDGDFPLTMPDENWNIPSGYSTFTDSAQVSKKHFANKFIHYAMSEAKMLFIMRHWDKLFPHWYEVYNGGDTRAVTQQLPPSNEVFLQKKWVDISTDYESRSGVVSYEIALQDGYHCLPTSAKDMNEDGINRILSDVCDEGEIGKLVHSNMIRCGPCTKIKPTICEGFTKCQPPTWLRTEVQNVNSITNHVWDLIQKSIIENFPFAQSIEDKYMSNFTLNMSAPRFDGLFAEESLTWDGWNSYNPSSATVYEQMTGKVDNSVDPPTVNVEDCIDGSKQKDDLFVDYTKCDMNQGIQNLKKSVEENYVLQRGVRVRGGERVSWNTTKNQFTDKGSVPYWSEFKRSARDQFVTWLLNDDDHCKYGGADRFNSVCFVDDADRIRIFNPWMGGDFSVKDKCDNTKQNELGGGRRIDTKCDNNVCINGATSNFSMEQVSYCWERHGTPANDIVVPDNLRSNLCMQIPRLNRTCLHAQGTLAGTGNPVNSLYETVAAKDCLETQTFRDGKQDFDEARGGLFVQPKHTAFFGMSQPTTSGKAGLFRVDTADIAGHHLRFVVENDGLRISDVMLQSYTGLGEADNQPNSGLAWLQYSLQTEDSLATPDITDNLDWACPLRQQAFLSDNEKNNFNAIFPDGRRA
jgi:hypothetical protein